MILFLNKKFIGNVKCKRRVFFKKKKKKEKNFYFIRSRSDRSVQLNGHRLRTCRDENYFKRKGNEISTDHERTFVQSLIFRRCWYIIRTRVRKEMRNWCVLVNLLG